MTQLTPSQEDPFVHELLAALPTHGPRQGFADRVMARVADDERQLTSLLSALPTYAPGEGFADRVMSHVWQPAPSWIQRAARIRTQLFTKRRAWMWAGALSTASALTTIIAIAAVLSFRVQVATAMTIGWSLGMELWRLTIATTTTVTVTAARWADPLLGSTNALSAFALASAGVMAISVFGLQRTIRQYRTERVVLHAGR